MFVTLRNFKALSVTQIFFLQFYTLDISNVGNLNNRINSLEYLGLQN